jgi:hypothetical protein
MAFNPFHRFRKHQKVFLAILAIVCMITFVFSFGAGDPFTRLLGAFGRQRKGELVTTLYGKKIYQGDLQKLTQQRGQASDFLQFVHEASLHQLRMQLKENKATLEKIAGDDRGSDSLGGNVRKALDDHLIVLAFLDQFREFPVTADTAAQSRKTLEMLRNAQLFAQKDGKNEYQALPEKQKQAIDELLMLLELESVAPSTDEYYFGGSHKPEDLLDFLVWKQQADRLGIVVTDESLLRMLNRLAGERKLFSGSSLDAKENQALFFNYVYARNAMGKQGPAPKASEVSAALIDEFRVALAKEALQGDLPRTLTEHSIDDIYASPAQPTPDEFLRYYREQRTTLQLALLDLAVDKFLPEVKEAPSLEVLEKLFNKYKDVEPSPDRDRPAFKEPRRMRLMYVLGKPDSPTFLKRAQAAYDNVLAASRFGAFGTYVPAGGPVAGWAVNAALPMAFDLPLAIRYANYAENPNNRLDSWLQYTTPKDPLKDQRFADPTPPTLHDRSFLRARTAVANGFTNMAGAALTGGNAVTGVMGWYGVVWLYEEAPRRRAWNSMAPALVQTAFAPAGAQVIAQAQGMGPAGAAVYAALPVAYRIDLPRDPAPALDDVRSMLVDDLLRDSMMLEDPKTRRHQSFTGAILQEQKVELEKALPKFRDKPGDQADKELKELLGKLGLLDQFHAMETAKDRYGLAEDPALEELRKKFGVLGSEMPPELLAQLLQGPGTWSPLKLRSPDVLVWRAEDQKAYVPSFEDEKTRKKVEAEWRYIQARQLALKKAQEIDARVKKAQGKQGVGVTVQELRGEKNGRVFELSGVARLVPTPTATPTQKGYQPYVFPKDAIALPRPDTVNQMLNKLPHDGDSMLFSDLPQKHFYVAVVETRSTPEMSEFTRLYSNTPTLDSFWRDALMPHERRSFRDKFMVQLRKEAGATDKDGNFIIPESIRKGGQESDTGD